MATRSIRKKIIRKTVTLRKAKPKGASIIKKITSDKFFWVHNGPIIRSLPELVSAIETMSDSQYYYHTKRDGNDFANWLENVLFLNELAKKIRRIRTRQSTIRILKLFSKNG